MATEPKLYIPSAPVVSLIVVPPPPVDVSVTIALAITAPVESPSLTTPLMVAACTDRAPIAKIDKTILIFLNIMNLPIKVIQHFLQ
jgi:hypothetical protein